MTNHFSFNDGKLQKSDNGSIYLVSNPNEEDRLELLKEFNIDEHNYRSALDPDELSRLEIDGDHIALIFKSPKSLIDQSAYQFKVISIGAFLFKDKLIILSNDEIDNFDSNFENCNSLSDILFSFLANRIRLFYENLKIINKISDELESKINRAMENKYLVDLFNLGKSLVYYLNAISSNSALLEKLKANSKVLEFDEKRIAKIEDLIIDNNQYFRQAEIYSNILASMMDARVSIVSNNLNVLMKNLALLTILFMLPTLIVSIFSMNVPIPLSHEEWAFSFVLFLSFLSALIFIILWRIKKW